MNNWSYCELFLCGKMCDNYDGINTQANQMETINRATQWTKKSTRGTLFHSPHLSSAYWHIINRHTQPERVHTFSHRADAAQTTTLQSKYTYEHHRCRSLSLLRSSCVTTVRGLSLTISHIHARIQDGLKFVVTFYCCCFSTYYILNTQRRSANDKGALLRL